MRELTPNEQEVIDLLGSAADVAAALPEVHPSDRPEFCAAIHACQNIIYARPAFEHAKSTWPGPRGPASLHS